MNMKGLLNALLCVLMAFYAFGMRNDFNLIYQTEDDELFGEIIKVNSVYEQNKLYTNGQVAANKTSLAFDHQRNILYVHIGGNITFIQPEDNGIKHDMRVVYLPDKSLSKYRTQIGLDTRTGNIYTIDSFFKRIEVRRLITTGNKQNNVSVILIEDGLDNPTSIAVDEEAGIIFWSDTGHHPKIERASLSGFERKTLILGHLLSPVSITVDTKSKRLYYSDTSRKRIESSDYQGTDRKVVECSIGHSYTNVIVTQTNHLAAIDGKSNNLFMFDIENNVKNIVTVGKKAIVSIAVAFLNTTKANNLDCEMKACQDICTHDGNNARCLCRRDSYPHPKDDGICIDDNYPHRALISTNGRQLSITDISVIRGDSVDSVVIAEAEDTITTTALDMTHMDVYYSVGGSISRFSLMSDLYLSLRTGKGTVTAMTFDWIQSVLYWVDENSNICSKPVTTIGEETTLLSGLDDLHGLEIDVFKRILFTIERAMQRIVVIDIDDTTRQWFISVLNPDSMTYCVSTKRLYWSTDGGIVGAYWDGTDRQVYAAWDYRDSPSLLEIMLYKDKVILISEMENGNGNGTDIHLLSKSKKLLDESRISLENKRLRNGKILDGVLQPELQDLCRYNNGGCQQLCDSNNKVSKCQCEFGFRLGDNGFSCLSDSTDKKILAAIDEQNARIYTIDVGTEGIHATNITISEQVTALVSIPKAESTKLLWTEDSSWPIRQADFNGANPTWITMNDGHIPRGATVSKGDIYVTMSRSHSGYILRIQTNGSQDVFLKDLRQPGAITMTQKEWLIWVEKEEKYSCLKMANAHQPDPIEIHCGTNITSLAADIHIEGDKLFWLESSEGAIYYGTIDYPNAKLNMVTLLYQDKDAQLTSFTVFDDYLYAVARMRLYIIKINKETGQVSQVAPSIYYGQLTIITAVERVRCPVTVPNGKVSKTCIAYPGYTCEVRCDDEHTSIYVQCLNTGDWDISANIFCLPVCPAIVPGGYFSTDCDRNPGKNCTVTCEDGRETTALLCLKDGKWERRAASICTKTVQCPPIKNVNTTADCSRDLGTDCFVICPDDNSKWEKLRCLDTGNWSKQLDQMCTEVTKDDANMPAVITLAVTMNIFILLFFAVVVMYIVQYCRHNKKVVIEGSVKYRKTDSDQTDLKQRA